CPPTPRSSVTDASRRLPLASHAYVGTALHFVPPPGPPPQVRGPPHLHLDRPHPRPAGRTGRAPGAASGPSLGRRARWRNRAGGGRGYRTLVSAPVAPESPRLDRWHRPDACHAGPCPPPRRTRSDPPLVAPARRCLRAGRRRRPLRPRAQLVHVRPAARARLCARLAGILPGAEARRAA